MSLINYASKEVTLKVVYYGPGLSGKTTNLQYLHSAVSPERRGKLLSLATESDRTLFFDFMPMTLGKIGDFTVKFQLYTVPGQVRYNATRKLVLKGADAVVFVADSQKALREQNIESYENMLENLSANNLDPDDIPTVLQYNKRDLDEVMSINVMNKDLNYAGYKYITAEAVNGTGVEETFQLVTQQLLKHFANKHRIAMSKPEAKEAPQKTPEPTKEVEPSVPTPVKAPPPSRTPPPTTTAFEAPLSAEEEPREPEFVDEGPSSEPAHEMPPVQGIPPSQATPEPEEVEVSVVEEERAAKEAPPAKEEPAAEEEPVAEEEQVVEEEPAIEKASPFLDRDYPSLEKELDKKRQAELEREALERELHEAAFAKRDLPSIEEFMRGPDETSTASIEVQSTAIGEALKEISGLIRETQLGGWLEKLVYSIDSNKQAVSELVSELKTSRKNQETMIDILKKIEKGLKQTGKSTKKS